MSWHTIALTVTRHEKKSRGHNMTEDVDVEVVSFDRTKMTGSLTASLLRAVADEIDPPTRSDEHFADEHFTRGVL